ncbi:MAG: transcriptional repressor [Bacteroidales bacterium]|nr:transcriptional repressor [Bacteroidales bacterium]
MRKFLKKHSLKATPQRLAVHETMVALGHACADQVVEYIHKNKGQKITQASVYNILRELALLGLYGYRASRTNKMFFDVNAFEHPHMYDVENNVYRDIMDDDLVSIVDDFLGRKKFKGYTVEGFDIQILVRPTRRKYKTAAGTTITQVSSPSGRKKIASRKTARR